MVSVEDLNKYIYETVPDGAFPATYLTCEETAIKSQMSGNLERVLRHVFVVEVDGKKVEINCLSDLKPTPYNRFGKIFRAIEGHEIKPLERAPVEKWVGKPVVIIVETKKGRAVITNVLPPKA